jgi:protein ImuA
MYVELSQVFLDTNIYKSILSTVLSHLASVASRLHMLTDRNSIIATLERQVQSLESSRRTESELLSTGCAEFDKVLPGNGFHCGTLVEWLGEEGSGAVGLSLLAARRACESGKAFVVIDSRRQFYPPAAANQRIDLAQTVLVRPRNQKDYHWTMHQALACRGVGAVLCWPEKLDDRAFRRMQLAAERGGSLGLFIRPASVRGQPTWSEIQLLVRALPCNAGFYPATPTLTVRRLQIELLRAPGGKIGHSVELEFDDEHGVLQASRIVPLAAALAHRAAAQRSSRA